MPHRGVNGNTSGQSVQNKTHEHFETWSSTHITAARLALLYVTLFLTACGQDPVLPGRADTVEFMTRDRKQAPLVLSRIYTRTGDDGTTALGDASRTAKTDLRLAAYADVDEANCSIGVAVTMGQLPAGALRRRCRPVQPGLAESALSAAPDRRGLHNGAGAGMRHP
jgi:hypothetical protein